MKVENSITTAHLDADELKKVVKEWNNLKFNGTSKLKNFSMSADFPNLYDFMEALAIQSQNRSHVTDRKINTY